MNWMQPVEILERQVPAGDVTAYAEVSIWGYGEPNRNQPVGSLLRGARNSGFQLLTNRVVGADGKLADLPDGPDQQKRQLLAEGVPFTADSSRVDFGRISPTSLV